MRLKSIFSTRCFVALATYLAVTATVVPGQASAQQPQPPHSYVEFINGAYMGAYGSGPTCFQRQLEFDNLVNAAANGALLAEAQHFVATLFETQASLDDPSLANYVQTSRYQALNPSPQTPDLGLDRFITDLYNAFLLRPPDDDGKNFWLQNNNGRKHLIIAFEVSIEFGDLVSKLYEDDTPPCCITRCPSGEAFNSATCSCEPVDPYFILVDSNLYFRKEQFTRTCKGDQSDAVWNRL